MYYTPSARADGASSGRPRSVLARKEQPWYFIKAGGLEGAQILLWARAWEQIAAAAGADNDGLLRGGLPHELHATLPGRRSLPQPSAHPLLAALTN